MPLHTRRNSLIHEELPPPPPPASRHPSNTTPSSTPSQSRPFTILPPPAPTKTSALRTAYSQIRRQSSDLPATAPEQSASMKAEALFSLQQNGGVGKRRASRADGVQQKAVAGEGEEGDPKDRERSLNSIPVSSSPFPPPEEEEEIIYRRQSTASSLPANDQPPTESPPDSNKAQGPTQVASEGPWEDISETIEEGKAGKEGGEGKDATQREMSAAEWQRLTIEDEELQEKGVAYLNTRSGEIRWTVPGDAWLAGHKPGTETTFLFHTGRGEVTWR